MGAVSKSIFTSKTIWTLAVGLLANILTVAGVHVLDNPDTQLLIVNTVMILVAGVFRTQAQGPLHITSPVVAALVGLAALVALAACAGPTVRATVTNDVAAAEIALTVADQAALAYTSQPGANPAIKARIKALAQTAYNAVLAAKQNAALLSVAVEAIANLRAAVPAAQP